METSQTQRSFSFSNNWTKWENSPREDSDRKTVFFMSQGPLQQIRIRGRERWDETGIKPTKLHLLKMDHLRQHVADPQVLCWGARAGGNLAKTGSSLCLPGRQGVPREPGCFSSHHAGHSKRLGSESQVLFQMGNGGFAGRSGLHPHTL